MKFLLYFVLWAGLGQVALISCRVHYEIKGPSYIEVVDGIGFRPKANTQSLVTKRLAGQVVFESLYIFDSFHRRVASLSSTELSQRRDQPSFGLFFGGSFIFGEGVPYKKSLPGQMGRIAPQTAIYNYGFSAYGPTQMLFQLQRLQWSEQVPQKKGFALYLAIPAHLARAQGATTHGGSLTAKSPVFQQIKGSLEYQGVFEKLKPLPAIWVKSLVLLRQIIGLRIDWNVPVHSQIDYFVKVIVASQESFQQNFPSQIFAVAVYPDGSLLAESMTAALQASNDILVLETQSLSHELSKHQIPGDGHPNAKAYEILAQHFWPQLSARLNSKP